jgi:hypothetical protein
MERQLVFLVLLELTRVWEVHLASCVRQASTALLLEQLLVELAMTVQPVLMDTALANPVVSYAQLVWLRMWRAKLVQQLAKCAHCWLLVATLAPLSVLRALQGFLLIVLVRHTALLVLLGLFQAGRIPAFVCLALVERLHKLVLQTVLRALQARSAGLVQIIAHCVLLELSQQVQGRVPLHIALVALLDLIHSQAGLQLAPCVLAVLHRQLLIRPFIVVKIAFRAPFLQSLAPVFARIAVPVSYLFCRHRRFVFPVRQALFSLPVAAVIVFLAQMARQMHLWGSRLAVSVCQADTLKLLQAGASIVLLEQRVWRVTNCALNVQRDWLLSRPVVRAVFGALLVNRQVLQVARVCLAQRLVFLLMVRAHVSLVLLAHIQLLYLVFNVQLVFGANWLP